MPLDFRGGMWRCSPWGIPIIVCLMLIVPTMLVCANNVRAHKIGMYAWVEGDAVLVEGYFGGKSKAVNCLVWLQSADGKRLAEARTDADGMTKFKLADLPALTGDVTVILEAGEGHRTDYVLRASDLPGNVQTASPSPDIPPEAPGTKTVSKSGEDLRAESPDALRQAVATELQPVLRKLATLERLMLKELDKDPSVRDIVGGIGWILGLVGISAYFMAARRGKQP